MLEIILTSMRTPSTLRSAVLDTGITRAFPRVPTSINATTLCVLRFGAAFTSIKKRAAF